jgi:hypothetical protein
MVANGTVLDTITLADRVPVIRDRHLMIDNILQPELLRPRPFPHAAPTIPRGQGGGPPPSGFVLRYFQMSWFPIYFCFSEYSRTDASKSSTPDDDSRPVLLFYEQFLRFLRSNQSGITFIISVASVLASGQPLIDTVNHTAGLVFVIVGIVSATASAVLLAFRKALDELELALVKTELTKGGDAKQPPPSVLRK